MLDWKTSEQWLHTLSYGNLYLAYRQGYPLMVVEWRSGTGFKDIKTGEIVIPKMIAIINLPKDA